MKSFKNCFCRAEFEIATHRQTPYHSPLCVLFMPSFWFFSCLLGQRSGRESHMGVNWTGGISLLSSRGFWASLVAVTLALVAAFGTTPKKQWAYVKHPDGTVSEVDPTALTALPEGDVLMEGTEAEQVKEKIWTDRLLSVGTFVSTILAGYFIKKDPNVNSFFPPGKSPLPSVLLLLGTGGLLLGVCGCSNVERTEYATYRDADFNNTSIMRAEQASNSMVLAGDKNFDGIVSADEAGPVDATTQVPTAPIDLSALPNLNKLTIMQRNAWLNSRLEELKQSKLRYENSKAQDAKAVQGTGPFGFFTTLFGGGSTTQPSE